MMTTLTENTRGLLIPFAVSESGMIVAADEVERGLNCNCHCLECGSPLVARQGPVVRPYFAHLPSDGHIAGCGSGEGLIHKIAKQCLSESIGKAMQMGTSDHFAVLSEVGQEVRIQQANRVVDILASVEFRYRGEATRQVSLNKSSPIGTYAVAIEIAVWNHKDSSYCRDMEQVGMPAFEIDVEAATIYQIAAERNIGIMAAFKQLLLGHMIGRWLSFAGLPDEVVASACTGVTSYVGRPGYIIDRASAALKSGDWQKAKRMLGIYGPLTLAGDDKARWVKGAALIAESDPERGTCPDCLRSKQEDYPLCWDCNRIRIREQEVRRIAREKERIIAERREQNRRANAEREHRHEQIALHARAQVEADAQRRRAAIEMGAPAQSEAVRGWSHDWDTCDCGARKRAEYEQCYNCAFY